MLNLILPIMVSVVYSTLVNTSDLSMESVAKVQKEVFLQINNFKKKK